MTGRTRVAKCHRCRIRPAGTVDVYQPEPGASAYYRGLATCGSIWLCPVCSAQILAERRDEVLDLFKAMSTTNAGRRKDGADDSELMCAAMHTITLPHRAGQRLTMLWSMLQDCWRKVNQYRAMRLAKQANDVFGYTRSFEVTHGSNGWHPHLHVVWIFDREMDDASMQGFADIFFKMWEKALTKAGFDAPSRDAMDIRRVTTAEDVAEYVTKASDFDSVVAGRAAYEVAAADTKKGRTGSRSHFQILADLVHSPTSEDLALWDEWEAATGGRPRPYDVLTGEPLWDYELDEPSIDMSQVTARYRDEFVYVTEDGEPRAGKIRYPGRRAMTWSRGLKDWAASVNASEEEESEEPGGSDTETDDTEDIDTWEPARLFIADFPRDVYSKHLSAGLLDAVESGLAHIFVMVHGIETLPPGHDRVLADLDHERNNRLAASAAAAAQHTLDFFLSGAPAPESVLDAPETADLGMDEHPPLSQATATDLPGWYRVAAYFGVYDTRILASTSPDPMYPDFDFSNPVVAEVYDILTELVRMSSPDLEWLCGCDDADQYVLRMVRSIRRDLREADASARELRAANKPAPLVPPESLTHLYREEREWWKGLEVAHELAAFDIFLEKHRAGQ